MAEKKAEEGRVEKFFSRESSRRTEMIRDRAANVKRIQQENKKK